MERSGKQLSFLKGTSPYSPFASPLLPSLLLPLLSLLLLLLFGSAIIELVVITFQAAKSEFEATKISEQYRTETASLQNKLFELSQKLRIKEDFVCDQNKLLATANAANQKLSLDFTSWSDCLESMIVALESNMDSIGQVLTEADTETRLMQSSLKRNSALVASSAAQLMDLMMTIDVQKEHILLLDSNVKEEASRVAEVLEEQKSSKLEIQDLQHGMGECKSRIRDVIRLSEAAMVDLESLGKETRSNLEHLEAEVNLSRMQCEKLTYHLQRSTTLLCEAEQRDDLHETERKNWIQLEGEFKRMLSDAEGRARDLEAELSSAEGSSFILAKSLSEIRTQLSDEQLRSTSLKTDLFSLREALMRTKCVGAEEMLKIRLVSEELYETVNDLRRDLDMRNAEVSGLISEIKGLRKNLKAAVSRALDSEEKVLKLREVSDSTQHALFEVQGAYDALKLAFEESCSKVLHLETTLDACKSRLQVCEDKNVLISEQLVLQEARFETVCKDRSVFEKSVSTKYGQLQLLAEQLNLDTKFLQIELDTNSAETGELTVQIMTLQASLADSAIRESAQEQRTQQVVNEILDLQAQLSERTLACERLNEVLDQNQAHIVRAEDEIRACQVKLVNAHSSVSDVSGLIFMAEEKAISLERELVTVQNAFRSLQEEFEAGQHAFHQIEGRLKSELDLKTKKISSLVSSNNNYDVKFAHALIGTAEQADNLEGSLSSAQDHCRQLTRELRGAASSKLHAEALLSEARLQLMDAEANAAFLQSRLLSRESSLREREAEVLQFTVKLNESVSASAAALHQLSVSEQESQVKDSETAALRVELMRIQSETEKGAQGYMENVEELKRMVNCTRFELEQRELEVMSITERCSSLMQEIAKLETVSASYAEKNSGLASCYSAMQAATIARNDELTRTISTLQTELASCTTSLADATFELASSIQHTFNAQQKRLAISEDSLRETRSLLSHVDDQIATRDSEIVTINRRLSQLANMHAREAKSHIEALKLYDDTKHKYEAALIELMPQAVLLRSGVEDIQDAIERFEYGLNQDESVERQFRALFLKNQGKLQEVRVLASQLEQEKQDGIIALEHVEEQLSRSLEHMQSTINDRENRILFLQREMKAWKEKNSFQYHASAFPFTTAEIKNLPHSQHQASLVIEALALQLDACSSIMEQAESGIRSLSIEIQGLKAERNSVREDISVRNARSLIEAELLEGLSPIPTQLCSTLKEVCKGLVHQSIQQKQDSRTREQMKQMMICLEISPHSTPSKGVTKIRSMQLELASVKTELDRNRLHVKETANQRQILGGELLKLYGLLDTVKVEFEMVREDLSCKQEVGSGIEQERLEMRESADMAEQMISLSEAHVSSFEEKLKEVELQCEANQQQMQRMERFVDELGETLDQEHVRVWEWQVDAERAEEQRADAERRLTELQAHYGDVCHELLKDRGPRDSRTSSKASLYSHADTVSGGLNIFGSQSGRPASLAAGCAARPGGPGYPLIVTSEMRVSDPLGTGPAGGGGACWRAAAQDCAAEDRLIAEKAELEWTVCNLQEDLERAQARGAELEARCSRLEGDLAAVREQLEEQQEEGDSLRRQVKEERLLAVEDRQRLMEELQETKSRQKQLVAAAQVAGRRAPPVCFCIRFCSWSARGFGRVGAHGRCVVPRSA